MLADARSPPMRVTFLRFPEATSRKGKENGCDRTMTLMDESPWAPPLTASKIKGTRWTSMTIPLLRLRRTLMNALYSLTRVGGGLRFSR